MLLPRRVARNGAQVAFDDKRDEGAVGGKAISGRLATSGDKFVDKEIYKHASVQLVMPTWSC